jgi:hypothetical protein
MYRRMMSSTMGSHPRSSIAMELSRIAPDAFPPKTVIGVYWINDDIDLGGLLLCQLERVVRGTTAGRCAVQLAELPASGSYSRFQWPREVMCLPFDMSSSSSAAKGA